MLKLSLLTLKYLLGTLRLRFFARSLFFILKRQGSRRVAPLPLFKAELATELTIVY